VCLPLLSTKIDDLPKTTPRPASVEAGPLLARGFHFILSRSPPADACFPLLAVTVELKNDISIRGTLKSVDQYLNIKLDDITVLDELKYPHLSSVKNIFIRYVKAYFPPPTLRAQGKHFVQGAGVAGTSRFSRVVTVRGHRS
jgi:small nuclear ribonucleoprotein (snRNP)-like protein